MSVQAELSDLRSMLSEFFLTRKKHGVPFKFVTEFPMFPTGCEYFYQENAWMDEGAMLEWLEKILKQFNATASENIFPLLL